MLKGTENVFRISGVGRTCVAVMPNSSSQIFIIEWMFLVCLARRRSPLTSYSTHEIFGLDSVNEVCKATVYSNLMTRGSKLKCSVKNSETCTASDDSNDVSSDD